MKRFHWFSPRPVHQGRARRRSGFTLLEIVITIAILSSVTLGTTLLLVPISRESRLRREMQIADAEAKRVLERLQALPFKSILTAYPQSTSLPIYDLPNGKATITYVDPASDPLVLQLVLGWDSPDLGAMSRTFDTVRTE